MKRWKYLEALKKKIDKKDVESVPHLEITEVVLLVHCNIVNNDYQRDTVYISSKKAICSIIKYLTEKFYIFKKI